MERLLSDLLMMAICGICVWTDLKSRKIYNGVLLPGFILALGLHGFYGGLAGIGSTFLGALVGLAILFVPFALGGMGAGDVKLLAVIGAIEGVSFLVPAVLCMGVVGGVISIVLLIRARRLAETFRYLAEGLLIFVGTKMTVRQFGGDRETILFPYGLAIGAGAFFTVAAQYLPLLGR